MPRVRRRAAPVTSPPSLRQRIPVKTFDPSSVPRPTPNAFRNFCLAEADVSVRMTDGSILVGQVVRCGNAFAEMRLWGRADVTRIALARVAAAAPVGPHTWSQRQVVRTRQRMGQPALVRGAGAR